MRPTQPLSGLQTHYLENFLDPLARLLLLKQLLRKFPQRLNTISIRRDQRMTLLCTHANDIDDIMSKVVGAWTLQGDFESTDFSPEQQHDRVQTLMVSDDFC